MYLNVFKCILVKCDSKDCKTTICWAVTKSQMWSKP